MKNYKHLTQVFLSVKVTLVMLDHNISKYFNQLTKLLHRLLAAVRKWGSKRLSNEKLKFPFTVNSRFSPKQVWMNNSRARLEFHGSWLKQDKVTFTSKTDSTLKDCLELLN